MRNRKLQRAKNAKNDEFYTQMPDIEQELRHYAKHFNGKVVYCNCDDPYASNFVGYFLFSFEKLGIRKLIATCYKYQGLFEQHNARCLQYEGDPDKACITTLRGDGDFRSEECIAFLKQSDIVVTNPPFSLFREYVAQLIEHDKKFVIIGNINAITCKDIFPLIRDDKIRLLVNQTPFRFRQPDSSFISINNVVWYTNLTSSRQREYMKLHKVYSPGEYPTYDNYDAIEVKPVTDIPVDYDGVMGVPITFLKKHNPDQFVILGCSAVRDPGGVYGRPVYIDGKATYRRLFIQKKSATLA